MSVKLDRRISILQSVGCAYIRTQNSNKVN
jgi:hypothetical protein